MPSKKTDITASSIVESDLLILPMIRRTTFLADFVRRSKNIESSSTDDEVVQTIFFLTIQEQRTHRTFWSCYEEMTAVKLPNIEETRIPIPTELDRYT